MEIEILKQQCGGTEFVPRPHRLHLGAQNAEGVDRLQFIPRDVGQLVLAAVGLFPALFAGKKPVQMLKIHEQIMCKIKEKIRRKPPKNQNIKKNTVEIAQKTTLQI